MGFGFRISLGGWPGVTARVEVGLGFGVDLGFWCLARGLGFNLELVLG